MCLKYNYELGTMAIPYRGIVDNFRISERRGTYEFVCVRVRPNLSRNQNLNA